MRTAIETWRHPGGQTVTLIGTIHVGAQEYYDHLGEIVARLQAAGARVHFEGIARPPEGAAMTADEVAAMKKMHTTEMYTWLAELIGLDIQNIPGDRTRWVNTDMNALEFLRALPDRDRFLKMFTDFETLRADLGEAPPWVGNFLRRVFRAATSSIGLAVLRPLIQRRRPDPNFAVIVDERNRFALRAIDVVQNHDVVAIWGAGHLPGIGQGLHQRGYRLVTRQRVSSRGGARRLVAVGT